jgi:glucokinase-like ROK family protein
VDSTGTKGSSQLINKMNKISILKLVREHKQISRADIAKISGISAPTVTRIVNSLIEEEKLVKEIGTGESSGGRRPTLVEFAAFDNFVIGVDIGKTHIDGVLSDLNANTITEMKIETKIHEGYDSIISRTADLICDLKNNKKVKNKKIFGVGLAVAGLVSKVKNVVEISPDFRWKNVNIEKSIYEKCKMHVIFDNVTRVMALGELWYGVGNEIKNFIVINLGYGIGSGIIIDGQPLYGPYGMAGEFGHITVDNDSDIQCACGNYGCLEALASGHSIAIAGQKSVKTKGNDKLLELAKGNIENITAEMVSIAARDGDETALHIWNQAIDHIGTAISGIVNLISPEMVLIGGGLAQSGDLIFDKVREIVTKRAIQTTSRKVKIEPVSFGMQAASKGAIALILNEVLNLKFSEN